MGAGLASAAGTGVLAGGQTVYASPEHLYVAAPEWIDWAALEQESDGTPPQVSQGTDIHRFAIDPGRATYELSGHVDGTLLNQFAMDEHDGYLRVATTTGQVWSDQDTSESHVVVLGPGDGALSTVGSVSGLGRGETIHSVRFLGDVGYVVTFRQTDPLYTVDLSDPAAPAVTGELKILGYSAYLHPIGDGRLIGVGQDATEQGRTTGTQVALYDVRDPASPQQVAQAVLPQSSSSAEWDHHAFLWWPDTGLVTVPVSAYDAASQFEGWSGSAVDAEAATITEVGRVSHPRSPSRAQAADPGGPRHRRRLQRGGRAERPERRHPPGVRVHAADPAGPGGRRHAVDPVQRGPGRQRPGHARRHGVPAVRLAGAVPGPAAGRRGAAGWRPR